MKTKPKEISKQLEIANAKLKRIQKLVDEQAEDDALWGKAIYISEAYTQQELRKLHAVIEE